MTAAAQDRQPDELARSRGQVARDLMALTAIRDLVDQQPVYAVVVEIRDVDRILRKAGR